MAGRRIGEAFIRVRPDTTGFAREAQPGAAAAGKLAGQIFAGSFVGTFSGRLLGGLLQQAFRTVQSFARDTLGEAREAARIGRLTDAVLKSTGKAARVSAKDVEALSDRLGELAGVDDDTVQAGTNLLLTFTKVRNEAGKGNRIFDLATQAALDMSAAMHNGNVTTEGFRGTILQVGKALNDPVTGMNALRRAGVTFTDQQKKTIKSLVEQGKTAEAQKIILAELKKEFGGAAAASTDGAQKAQVAWANFKEEIGTALLPVLGRLASFFTASVLPAVRMFFNTLKTGKTEDEGTKIEKFALALRSVSDVITRYVIPALRQVGGIVGSALGWLTGSSTWAGVFRSALLGAVAAIVAITTAVKIWTAVQTVLNIVLTANPIGLIIVAVAALIAVIIFVATKTKFFQTIWRVAWGGIKAAALAVGRWFRDVLWTQWILGSLLAMRKWLIRAMVWWNELRTKIVNGLKGLGEAILAPFRWAFNMIARAWNATVGKIRFEIPKWVPKFGGKVFDVPDIPEFHRGGIVPGNGEMLALLRGGEQVLTREQRQQRGDTHIHVQAWTDRFSWRQVQDELALHGVH